ncbi:MBL fold metallo-hydrolase [Ochrobactrum sp. Q0168]|uniref:MBL fold metallo-hydrolase n=1 Tax=Ochrobactrum sp. Q0168 TaxID=2793241 RepID=UPI0018EC7A32|nr:MBL fold metallo-hydrolase [Ochrobactrum sp. Q0168]
MAQQVPLNNEMPAYNPDNDAVRDDGTHQLREDLAYKRLAIVNVVFYGRPGAGDRKWVLIDTGIAGMSGLIVKAAMQRFGPNSKAAAIILTHAHFDHAGNAERLSTLWDCPVFAHPLEFPYLNGAASYPPPDPLVGGGMMSLLSPIYPRGPIDIAERLQALPEDGDVPFMPDWKWLFTPGHSPGHISLWRAQDKALIAGDAFITTRQESLYSVLLQKPEIHGPPMYFTTDWDQAEISVKMLSELDPRVVVTGHGEAMRGEPMQEALYILADRFSQIAIPRRGKYVAKPARLQSDGEYWRC